MVEGDDIPVRSLTLAVAPESIPAFLEMVRESLGSHKSESKVGKGFHRSHFRFEREGRDLELYVDADDHGKVTLAFPASTASEDLGAVLAAIKSVQPRMFVGRVVVSLGVKRLAEPLHIGWASLARRHRPRGHDMHTAWNGFSLDEIVDHVMVFPVGGVGWSSSNRRAEETAYAMVPVVAFVLDIPVATYGHASAMTDQPLDKYGREHAIEALRAHGCVVEPATVDRSLPAFGQPYVEQLPDCAQFYGSLARMSEPAQEKVVEALRSYNQAMLLAKPEAGFERYEDKSTAVMLWGAIFETMADGELQSGKCEQCGKPWQSINGKLKGFLARLTAGDERPMSWKEFEQLRRVRHKVSHEALRPLQGLHGRMPIPVFEDPVVRLSVFGHDDMKALARKAILDFVGRHQPPREDGEEAKARQA